MSSFNSTELHDLIARVRQGDDEAFSRLVSLYSPMMNKVARSMSLDTEEVFSESCMARYKAALSFDTEQREVSFGLYAQICVTRRLCDLLRSHRSEEPVSDLDVEEIAVDGGILSSLERRELMDKLKKSARRVLSDYELRVLRLWLDGRGASDIAAELSTTVKSVENAKARILKKLRSTMS